MPAIATHASANLSRRRPVAITPTSRTKLSLAIAAALSAAAGMHGVPTLAATASSDATLEEVIVTARKRTENLEDVPISINVFTAKDLQNLSISQFEDYATLAPSISFVSAGPGTQTFVMRGVSDGSNPRSSNTASTAFLVDDMSMNNYGTTPDLHLYDIERIEVLNGPQGTTFGAGAMAGALRFITNKPDPTAFSAGVDLDVGKIDGGTHNSVVEAYVNVPLIPDWTAARLSVFTDYHGGFIDNLDTTRNWVNGTVSNNSEWAGRDYNTERVNGGRFALSQRLTEGWKATLTTSYQSQITHGAWDQEPTTGGAVDLLGQLVNGPVRSLGERNVDRFGPEMRDFFTKTVDFHVDGDAGIGDLVFASTWWAQDQRNVNEYSEYMQYVHTGSFNATSRQAFDCLTDPINGTGFSGCNVPIQYFDNTQRSDRLSDELRLQSKEGGRFHWLIGTYWEKTRNYYTNAYVLPGLQTSGQQFTAYASYYGTIGKPVKPDEWYTSNVRSDYLQTTEFANISFDITPRLSVEAGTVHFHSNFNTLGYGGYGYATPYPLNSPGASSKWDSKLGLSYKVLDGLLVYADAAQGFRDGGVNSGVSPACVHNGVPLKFEPDTVTNYEIGWKSTMLDRHLMWNGAAYYMPWKNLQSFLFDPDVCATNQFNANIGNALVYGMESDIKYQASEHWSMAFSASYNDSRVKTDTYNNPFFQVLPGERLPYVPYFNWSGNARYEAPIKDALHGYAQFDIAHKGDMWNELQATGSNGLPRVLQPDYSVMNVRLGVTQVDAHWLTEFYITNLTNKNAVIYTNEGNYDLRETVNEPRVFGLRLSYRFGNQQPRNTEN